jgi:hypothetical protein
MDEELEARGLALFLVNVPSLAWPNEKTINSFEIADIVAEYRTQDS